VFFLASWIPKSSKRFRPTFTEEFKQEAIQTLNDEVRQRCEEPCSRANARKNMVQTGLIVIQPKPFKSRATERRH